MLACLHAAQHWRGLLHLHNTRQQISQATRQRNVANNTSRNVISVADNVIAFAKNTNGNAANNTSRNVMSVANNVISVANNTNEANNTSRNVICSRQCHLCAKNTNRNAANNTSRNVMSVVNNVIYVAKNT